MQQLLSNFDLGEQNQCDSLDPNDVSMTGIPANSTAHCDMESLSADQSEKDSALLVDNINHNESLETTLDNEDDPLELTGDDDSEDAGDGGSSDEQQQSRSLSLSYSLSISHAQENFSQYSQSTDKGLSKRYDSPCSYEDDRESECTNFDKLDDWNDFIADIQNNNNGDAANREFREYYDEYLLSKTLKGSEDAEDSSEEYNIKGSTSETTGTSLDSAKDDKLDNRSTPAVSADMDQKSISFLEYRNPSIDMEDDPMDTEGDSCVSTGDPIQRVLSGKRKFRYDDVEDIEYEVTQVITEKFRKTDNVPFHGCHDPISLIDDELFARMVRIESSSKTPIPEDNGEDASNNSEFPLCVEHVDDEGNLEEGESNIATTPTNAKNLEQMFQSFEGDAHGGSVKKVNNPRLQHKMLPQRSAIKPSSSFFHHFDSSFISKIVDPDTD